MRNRSNEICPSCSCFIRHLPAEVRALSRHETVDAGELICRRGSPLHKVLFLCRGRAKAVGALLQEPDELGLPQWQAGAILGDQELFEGARCWRHSIRAQATCQVVALDPEIFLASLKHFDVAASLLRHTLHRNHDTQHAFIERALNKASLTNKSAT